MQAGDLYDKGYFRIKDWWSKAALLMGMVYLFTAWFNIPFANFVSLALLSVTTISGFASLGYLFNDLFDIKKDALAGKRNFLAGKSASVIAMLFFVAAAVLILPWRFLPFNYKSGFIIIAEIFLFWIYSAPPLRLKERGIPGILTDSLYAHALPVLLAAYTFSLAAGKAMPLGLISSLVLWQVMSGVRNILLHQFDDSARDAASKTKNVAVSIPISEFNRIIACLIAAELGAGICFFILLAIQIPLMGYCAFAILAFGLMAFFLFRKPGIEKMLQSKWKYFPNAVFEQLIPAVILLALTYSDMRFLIVLIIHLAVFNYLVYVEILHHGIYPIADKSKYLFVQSAIGIRRIASFILNNIIYYSFRIFGIDLIKENTSAMEYWRKQRKRQ